MCTPKFRLAGRVLTFRKQAGRPASICSLDDPRSRLATGILTHVRLAPHVSVLEVSLPQSAYLDILCMSCLHLVNGIVQNLIHLQQSDHVSSQDDLDVSVS